MKIKDLIPSEEYNQTIAYEDIDIDFCTNDFKKVKNKTLLFLLPGVNFDTYKLIPEFLKSKPQLIVTENKALFHKTKIPLIEVKNARRCFAYAMSSICQIDYKKLTFIGVTGTNGKTSVATIIKNILESNGRKCGFIGTGKIEFQNKLLTDENYSMTCPDPDVLYPAIKKMQSLGCEIIVMEASSHALQLEKLSAIKFKIGIFTSLSHEHLEFHKTMENYFKAKEKLINNCEKAIINCDDEYGKRLYKKYKNKSHSIGILERNDSYASDVKTYGFSGSEFLYIRKEIKSKIQLFIPGVYNVYNSMLAIEAGYQMNISLKKIKNSLKNLKAIDGRFECINGDRMVIIDYAHTPAALENLLKTIKCDKKTEQKICLIFGCGGDRDREKRPMMAECAEKYADRIIVTNDNPRNENETDIIKQIMSGFKNTKYSIIQNREQAIKYAIKSSDKNEIIVIAGKGHERYICDKNGYHFFDERIVINDAFKSLSNEESK